MSTTTAMSATKSEGPTVSVKLFVDKERSKVLFAESDNDFADVLFSFLTLPLGAIVRLLGKQSHEIGCLNEVYKSVEDLSAVFFRTKACKTMLLRPFNAAADLCVKLKVKIDDTNPREVFVCPMECRSYREWPVTFFRGSICKCGKDMVYIGKWPPDVDHAAAAAGSNGVFTKGCLKFIITDDLQVAPSSTSLMLSLFDQFGVRDPAFLEQKILQLNAEKITSLLKRSLTTKQAFTAFYFNAPCTNDDSYLCMLPEILHCKQEADANNRSSNVEIKVLQTKNSLSLLYAEVGVDFIDILFGLLSIPLGSITRVYGNRSSNGCVGNIYNSIVECTKGWLEPQCQMLLQFPKVAKHFSSGASKMLQAEEVEARREGDIGCCLYYCFNSMQYSFLQCHCGHSNCFSKSLKFYEINPKVLLGDRYSSSEGFVKPGVEKFMVTDDLRVLPLSLSATAQAVSESKYQFKDLVEKEFNLSKDQVMEILRAALVTRNALSSVLLHPRKKP
ncbi:hypothetical protein GUJ93_ZPchr0458g22407 [Zizania palustris]|uniref:DUF674 family protein n=1 Tax=Zizania palustris TaxID=103762 RepID=A0A8J5UZH4_ZIZPA|nr:hypothetical protein GUJ93_ZPchr0458g22407 [Zizania palustris]